MKAFRLLAKLFDQHVGNGAKPRNISGQQSRIRRERTKSADMFASGDTKINGGSPLLAQ